jgi:hypothetical protein
MSSIAVLLVSSMAASAPVLLFATRAFAQGAPSSSSASSMDIVKLRNGSLYRGTIVELVPNDHVRIDLPGGEERRFDMRDVAYAGAAPSERAPTADGTSDPRVSVHFTASEPGLDLLRATGLSESNAVGYGPSVGPILFHGESQHYALVCTAPCNPTLPPGSYDFALSAHGRLFSLEPVDLREATTIHADYASRRGVRILGWILAVTGAFTGGALMVSAVQPSTCPPAGPCSGGLDSGRFFGGLAIAGVSTVVGVLMGIAKDHVEVAVAPSSDP